MPYSNTQTFWKSPGVVWKYLRVALIAEHGGVCYVSSVSGRVNCHSPTQPKLNSTWVGWTTLLPSYPPTPPPQAFKALAGLVLYIYSQTFLACRWTTWVFYWCTDRHWLSFCDKVVHNVFAWACLNKRNVQDLDINSMGSSRASKLRKPVY